MMDYWKSLTDRERLLISVAGGLFIIVVLYLAAFRPLMAFHESSERELLAAQRVHSQIVHGASILSAYRNTDRSSAHIAERRPLRVSVSTAARATGVAISRIQPGEDGSLTVWVESVASNELYRWLNHMADQSTITPAKVLVQKSAAAGRLRVQLQFEASL